MMSRKEIKKLFKKHRGSGAKVARRAGVGHPAVSNWLSGETKSENIAGHAQRVAQEILSAKGEEV